MNHSASQILRQLIIDGSLATSSSTWPAYTTRAPDSPDNLILLRDTVGRKLARHMPTGVVCQLYGVQILIRATDHQTAWQKTESIKDYFAESIRQDVVNVTSDVEYGTDSVSYLVDNIMFVSGPLPTNPPNSALRIFSINFLANIRQLT